MTYDTALKMAAKAIKVLTDGEGNLSEYEMIATCAALDFASKVIAKRNGDILASGGDKV